MASKNKSKLVYLLVTKDKIYRTNEILDQIAHWIDAFKNGSLIQVPNSTTEGIDEFEAHLESVYLETEKLLQNYIKF